MVLTTRLSLIVALVAAAGCASANASYRVPTATAATTTTATTLAQPPQSSGQQPCADCAAAAPDAQVTQAIEKRLVELKARGGFCSSYGAVLENSYRTGQITMRPFMWREGDQLTSGAAKPNGEMILAREIDALNVGVRTVDDVVRTMEHEAAHIAFRLDNDLTYDRADAYVRACRDKGDAPQRVADRPNPTRTDRP